MSLGEWDWAWVGQRVLEALGNGVWQGILAAGLIWAGFRFLPKLNAATRYAAAFVALLLAAALPVAQLGLKLLPPDFFQKLRPLQSTEPVDAVIDPAPYADPIPTPWTAPSEPVAHEPSASAPIMEGRAPRVPLLSESFPIDPSALASLPPEPALDPAPESTSPAAPFSWNAAALRKEWIVAVPAIVTLAFLAIWAGVSGCRLGALGLQCLALRRIKRQATAGSEALLEEFDKLRAEMKLSRKVRLGLSEQALTPMAAGFLRPMIILPPKLATLLDSPCCQLRLQGVLRHELAHIARRDDWTNLLQQVLHAIYFFHPGVCWLARRMTLEREIACDDHVLAAAALAGGATRREYALLLTDFARQMQGPGWAAAPGAWGSENQLKERVHMILNKNRNASPRLAGAKAGVLTVGAVLIALLAMQAGPRLALADESKPESDLAVAIAGEAPAAEPEAAVTLSLAEPQVDVNVSVDAAPKIATTIERSADGRSLAVVTTSGSSSSSAPAKIIAGGGGRAVIVAQSGDVLEVETAPRHKPGRAGARAGAGSGASASYPAPHPAPAPEPPAGLPPHAALPAQPAQPAQPGQPPQPARRAERDLERRLERLERLVENLDRKDGKNEKDVWKHDFKWEMKEPNFDFKFDEGKFKEQMAKLESDLKNKFNPNALKHIHEEASRAAERAHQDAERAAERAHQEAERAAERAQQVAERVARDVERSMRDHEKNAKTHQELALKLQNDGEEQAARAGEGRRKALEQRRQALEKELREIERQIDRAEEEQERIREEREERKREKQERKERENRNSNSNNNNDDNGGGDGKPEIKIKKRAPQEEKSSDNAQN